MYFEVVSILKAKAKGLGVVPSSMLDANDVAASELYWVRTYQEALVQDKMFEVDRKLQFGLFSDSAGVWSMEVQGTIGECRLASLYKASNNSTWWSSLHISSSAGLSQTGHARWRQGNTKQKFGCCSGL